MEDAKVAFYTITTTPYSLKFIFDVVLQAFGVYFNLYFLIPNYLQKRKYGVYFFTLSFTIFCTSIILTAGNYTFVWIINRFFSDMYQMEKFDWIKNLSTDSFPNVFTSMTLVMSIKLTKNWLQSMKREQVLANEKLETELKFLRSQFNPHFLFNSINSIFHLIHKNPIEASESLTKFSDLLRYQLYECNELQIPLDREIAYLNNFIGLERIRHENSLKVLNNLEDLAMTSLTISPFLLMPFIENAFKHVSREKSEINFITIDLKIVGFTITMEVINSMSTAQVQKADPEEAGGLGLQNVHRRLELLYPGKHQLEITVQDRIHHVTLSLELSGKTNYLLTRKDLSL
jgi:two-component system, LytTR family, sensor kinase